MVNFAELKAKAEKAKDASVSKMTNARDRLSSAPSSPANYNPHWKRAPPPPAGSASPSSLTGGPPPPPLRSRPDIVVSGADAAPLVPRASRPSDSEEPPSYTPRPPPTRAASGYPPHDVANKIDWANLSHEDKEAFFGWLDEFFSRYFGMEVGAREQSSATSLAQYARPAINMATRPPA